MNLSIVFSPVSPYSMFVKNSGFCCYLLGALFSMVDRESRISQARSPSCELFFYSYKSAPDKSTT